ncbi:MAG: lipocalin family protein [Deltaproteobacteria bacterium]|nr:lipocalin family protein [Deltaproteobacteria bacterium]
MRALPWSFEPLVLGAALLIAACAGSTTKREGLPPLQAVERVELPRYLGTWYEIASYPQRFQKGCSATTATYSQGKRDQITVLNRCRKGGLDGKVDDAEGRARVVDTTTNAKLEVSFFGPFWGDYWIIDLDPEYQWAVVGHPGRDYLWILSRTPQLGGEALDGILARLGEQHYDTTRLQWTEQPQAPET